MGAAVPWFDGVRGARPAGRAPPAAGCVRVGQGPAYLLALAAWVERARGVAPWAAVGRRFLSPSRPPCWRNEPQGSYR